MQATEERGRGGSRVKLALGLVVLRWACGALAAGEPAADSALTQAQVALDDQRFAVAVELLEPLVAADASLAGPAGAELVDAMARAYYGAGKVVGLTNLLARSSGATLGYWEGRLALDAGAEEAALALVDTALGAEGVPPRLLGRLLRLKAWALIGLGDASAAIAALEACLATDDGAPEMGRARHELARLLLAEGTISLVDGVTLPSFASSDYRLGEFDAITAGLKFGWKTGAGNEMSVRVETYQQNGTIPSQLLIGNQIGRETYPDLDALIVQFSYQFSR